MDELVKLRKKVWNCFMYSDNVSQAKACRFLALMLEDEIKKLWSEGENPNEL